MTVNHLKKSARIESVADLREFIAGLPDDMDVCAPTMNGWDFVEACEVGINSWNGKEQYILSIGREVL